MFKYLLEFQTAEAQRAKRTVLAELTQAPVGFWFDPNGASCDLAQFQPCFLSRGRLIEVLCQKVRHISWNSSMSY